MDGTSSQRAWRLCKALVQRPRFIPGYLAHLPLWKRAPLDVGLPLFSYGAIDYIARLMRPGQKVFEYGSGGSTVFFARRAQRVVSVENEAEWQRMVSARLAQLGLTNVDCQLHAFGDAEAGNYGSLPYFNVLTPNTYDIIIVDGFCGYGTGGKGGQLRPYALAQARAAVKRPGLVVLDDAWMFPEAEAVAGVKPHLFQGIGPCRYGVTSTAVFRFD